MVHDSVCSSGVPSVVESVRSEASSSVPPLSAASRQKLADAALSDAFQEAARRQSGVFRDRSSPFAVTIDGH